MMLSIRLPLGVKGQFKWLLNESLLSNPVHCTMFAENETVSPTTLWAAHKSVMRGKPIQISSQLKSAEQTVIAI